MCEDEKSVLTRLLYLDKPSKKRMLPSEKRWRWLDMIRDPGRFSTTNQEQFANPASLLLQDDADIDNDDRSTGIDVSNVGVSTVSVCPQQPAVQASPSHGFKCVNRRPRKHQAAPKRSKLEREIQRVVTERRAQPPLVHQATPNYCAGPTPLFEWRMKQYKADLAQRGNPPQGKASTAPPHDLKRFWLEEQFQLVTR
eukprot:TRINITY_DN10715_c0_g1_i1.p1 TRINITY_DN10715_c0_g1~~TRINITY_DN10715_c0_g1_i1.p1  ORF type:complete len:205 (+),score=21.02 TRINITY_DN10715_c0_g1_i1:27-617(+)